MNNIQILEGLREGDTVIFPPELQKIPLRPIAERVVFLETRLPVNLSPGPDVTLLVDPIRWSRC